MRALLLIVIVFASDWCHADLEFRDVKVIGMGEGRHHEQRLKSRREAIFSKVSEVGKAAYQTKVMSYKTWKNSGHTGMFTDLLLSPNAIGFLADVNVDTVVPLKLANYSKYAGEKQFEDFVNYVNLRNKEGRPTYHFENALEFIEEEEENTTVVQTIISTLIPVSKGALEGMTTNELVELVQEMDSDHFHYTIPFSLVTATIGGTHIGHTYPSDKNYMLSVFDFREYECEGMRSKMSDYFKSRERDDGSMTLGMQNSSIYSLSMIDEVGGDDLENTISYFGKKPFLAFSQKSIFSDYLIVGASTHFFFFKEKDETRFVVVSNVGLYDVFFSAAYVAYGVPDKLLNGWPSEDDDESDDGDEDALSEFVEEATDDARVANICGRGLALGVTKFSQEIFTRAVERAKSISLE